jgi:hypothetical protein
MPARVTEVRSRIGAAARRAGRPEDAVTLVAVTKGVGVESIEGVLDAGVNDLGESRAQELLAKAPVLSEKVGAWHFVGRLQRNKVAALAPFVTLWQSVDRVEVATAIARRAPHARVLVEVNASGDPRKAGCPPDEAPGLVDALRGLDLDVRGLMTVPALGPDPRPAFATLRELAARLDLAELSMGMSEDFETAVEEGATMVRVGRALFGPRNQAPHLQR